MGNKKNDVVPRYIYSCTSIYMELYGIGCINVQLGLKWSYNYSMHGCTTLKVANVQFEGVASILSSAADYTQQKCRLYSAQLLSIASTLTDLYSRTHYATLSNSGTYVLRLTNLFAPSTASSFTRLRYSNQYCIREASKVSKSVIAFCTANFCCSI